MGIIQFLCWLLNCCDETDTVITPGPVVPTTPYGPPGEGPDIAVFTQARNYTKTELAKFLPAMQKYIDEHLAPVWATPAKLILTDGPIPGAWWIVFLDTADAPGALAYHDLTSDGLPLGKVFVDTIAQSGSSLSVATTHELAEMLVDPFINLSAEYVFTPIDTIFAYEVADAVEADEHGFDVDGYLMSNFVHPEWFEDFNHKPGTKLDHVGYVKEPFQVLRGGYMIVNKGGQWGNVFAKGDAIKKLTFAGEDRRGHRSEQRGKKDRKLSKCIPANGHK